MKYISLLDYKRVKQKFYKDSTQQLKLLRKEFGVTCAVDVLHLLIEHYVLPDEPGEYPLANKGEQVVQDMYEPDMHQLDLLREVMNLPSAADVLHVLLNDYYQKLGKREIARSKGRSKVTANSTPQEKFLAILGGAPYRIK